MVHFTISSNFFFHFAISENASFLSLVGGVLSCSRSFLCTLGSVYVFMKRARSDEEWSLFCPSEAPGLADCWGKEFEKLYIGYEQNNR